MEQQQKRLLSPDQSVSSPKVSKLSNQNKTIALRMPLATNNDKKDQMILCSKEDILEAIKESVAEEFRRHDEEKLIPIINDITAIKEELIASKEERGYEKERLIFLERQMKQRNLIFSNIPLSADPEMAIRETCKDILLIKEAMHFDKVITLKSNQTDNKMNLLVVFGSQSLAEKVLKSCKNLRGTGIAIGRDLCKEDREARDKLLKLRKCIKEKDHSQSIKVYGNEIIVNKVKLTYSCNFFGNKKLKVDGFKYIEEKFGIDCKNCFDCNQ